MLQKSGTFAVHIIGYYTELKYSYMYFLIQSLKKKSDFIIKQALGTDKIILFGNNYLEII